MFANLSKGVSTTKASSSAYSIVAMNIDQSVSPSVLYLEDSVGSRVSCDLVSISSAAVSLAGVSGVSVTSPSHGHVLTYDSSSADFVNASISLSLSDLSDVSSLGPSTGNFLVYDGSSFDASNSSTTLTLSTSLVLADGANQLTISAPSGLASYAISLPSAQGVSGSVLSNDGSGNLFWSNANPSAFNGLVDTASSAPSDGDFAVYSSTSSLWEFKKSSSELTLGTLKIEDASNNAVTVGPPASISPYALTLPAAQGASNSVLLNDGSGALSFGSLSVESLSNTSSSTPTANTFMVYDGSSWQYVTQADSLTLTSSLSTNTISERTAAVGVTIDGVLLKDNSVTVSDVNASSLNSTSNTTVGGLLSVNGTGMRLKGYTSNNYITIQAHTSSSAHTLTLPSNNPTTDSYLMNTSSGIATWTPITNSYASKRVRIVYVPTISSKYVSFSSSGSTGATYNIARQSSIGRFSSGDMSYNQNTFTINTTGVFKYTVSIGFTFAATTANQFRFSYIRLRAANNSGAFASGSVVDDGNLGTSNGTTQTTNNKSSFVPANSTYNAFDKIEASFIFKVTTAGVIVQFFGEVGLNGGLQTSLSDSGVGALTAPSTQTDAISYMQLEQLA